MGKAYANKRKKSIRPIGDYYSTPKSLVWVAQHIIFSEFETSKNILEPCVGKGAISEELLSLGYSVVENDLYNDGFNYLTTDWNEKQVITNPPFSLWNEFVVKSKTHADKIMMIGRMNYLGTHSRNINNIWKNLKAVYVFDRYVDYQTPYREDGCFHVGAMATAWFLWDSKYDDLPIIQVLDVQKYATLGNYK